MDILLDEADKLVLSSKEGEPDRPNFIIPYEKLNYDPSTKPYDLIELRDTPDGKKGRGWYAKCDIKAGSIILIEKPITMIMNWQDDTDSPNDENENEEEEDEEEQYSTINELLLIELLEMIHVNTNVWFNYLTNLYPRTSKETDKLPAWVCQNDELFIEVENKLQELRCSSKNQELITETHVNEIKTRLPLIIRYNALSVETCPELLVHPSQIGGHSSISGTGLYYLSSYFNHSCKPNISRYAIGDVMFFVTNTLIQADDELCISYIEHDVLCESSSRRTKMLQMDFIDTTNTNETNNDSGNTDKNDDDDDGPDYPVVDDFVQNELMNMVPTERLIAIKQLMDQAMGLGEEDEDDNDSGNEEDMLDASGRGGINGSSRFNDSRMSFKSTASMEEADEEDDNNVTSSENRVSWTSIGSLANGGGGDAAEGGGGGGDNDDDETMVSLGSLVQNMKVDDSQLLEKYTKADSTMPVNGNLKIKWFTCDVKNLKILRAITLDGLGKHVDALREWEDCITLYENKLPPYDEILINLHVQAALCARMVCCCSASSCSNSSDNNITDNTQQTTNNNNTNSSANIKVIAQRHADSALLYHEVLFGGGGDGGVALFRRRYKHEIQLSLRPNNDITGMKSGGIDAFNDLWPL